MGFNWFLMGFELVSMGFDWLGMGLEWVWNGFGMGFKCFNCFNGFFVCLFVCFRLTLMGLNGFQMGFNG